MKLDKWAAAGALLIVVSSFIMVSLLFFLIIGLTQVLGATWGLVIFTALVALIGWGVAYVFLKKTEFH